MTWTSFAALMLMNLVGAITPGPDIILITRLATRSRRHALAGAAGIQVGVLFWCTLTVLGAAALLTAFPDILGFVQLVGGAWLVWTGTKMVRGGWAFRHQPPADLAEAEAQLGRLRYSFRLGMATNLSNAKIVLFLSALIAPMIPANPPWWLAIVLILTLSFSSFLLFAVISFVISTEQVRRRLLAAGPWIDVAAGLFFIVAGSTLIVHGAMDIL